MACRPEREPFVRPMSGPSLEAVEEARRRQRPGAIAALVVLVAVVVVVTARAAARTDAAGMWVLFGGGVALGAPLAFVLARRSRPGPVAPGELWRDAGAFGAQAGSMVLRHDRLCWEPFDLRGPLLAQRWETSLDDLASVEVGRRRWGGLGRAPAADVRLNLRTGETLDLRLGDAAGLARALRRLRDEP